MVFYDESIGHRIRHLRKPAGLTEGELGARVDLSETAIRRIELDEIDVTRGRVDSWNVGPTQRHQQLQTGPGRRSVEEVREDIERRTREGEED